MKWWMPAIMMYGLICLMGIMLPASQGYDTMSWKLFVVQIYAIPIALIVLTITFFRHRKMTQ